MAALRSICIDGFCSEVDLTNYYNKSEVNALIDAVETGGFEVVQSLPSTGDDKTIYLVPNSGTTPNIYDEYIYVNNAWELIGTTEIDLTNYYNKSEVDGLLANKQNKLTAGTNISISGNTISATDTKYTGTTPITVSGTTITHDDSGVSAGAKGETGNKTPAFGATFKVPSFTVDAKGHVTVAADHTVNIPNSAATTSAAGLMSAADKTKLDEIDTTPYTGTSPITVTDKNITHDASGVTAGAKGETGNKTPAFGGTFKVPSFTVDDKGHVTVAADHTVKIPNSAATTSAAGLMSAADKTKLDGITAGAEPNQDAYGNVKVGSTTIAASAEQDTIEFVAGTGITLTPDASTKKITVAVNLTKQQLLNILGAQEVTISKTDSSGTVSGYFLGSVSSS